MVVEIGIRIGDRNFPKLVSHLTCDVNLLRTGEGGGKNGKLLHNVFSGVEACKWLLQHAYATHMNEAVAIGNALLMSGVLYAVEGYSQAWEVGFDSEGTLYRSMAHTDLSRELKKGARKDMLLRLLGVGRGKTSSASAILAQQSPWFEEQFSESFTSSSSAST